MSLIYLIIGACLGINFHYVWAKNKERNYKINEFLINVRCSHCGRMYRTSPGNVRVANHCMECG